ncbi:MAG: transglycosylase domain-containing protein [Bacteroidetes bacterium]|nr:transglycosylase domain-containing protein [Bacteroidota bacterium]
MYFNTVPFGNNAYGIKSASRIFFSTTPDSLRPEQAALLIGILKAPSWFNPVKHPERAQARRNVVLSQMKRYSFLSRQEYDSLSILPVKLVFRPEDHTAGLATYFREHIRLELDKWCSNHLKPDNKTPYNLYKDGLKIYTTIDTRMQRYAEQAVTRHMKDLQKEFFKHWKDAKNAPFDRNLTQQEINTILMQAVNRSERYALLKEAGISRDSVLKIFNTPDTITIFTWEGEKDTFMSPMDSIRYYKHFLQAGFLSMDPHTGHIKAWVGGVNYKHFQYDHVKQGKRQVGSAFKPFVYTLAIQEKWSPCEEVPNVPVIFIDEKGEKWSPKNSDDEFDGKMLAIEFALANSINTITAYVISKFGPQAVIDLSRRMGITSHLDPYPALCLGVADISVYEMTGAFSTYANKGIWTEPTYLLKIEDHHGNILEEFTPKTSEAMSEETAWVMLRMLKGVVDGVYSKSVNKRIGTGVRLRFKYDIRNPVAGKTGTTQNYSDGWFIGITPDLVSGVWVGCEDRSVHFRSMFWGQGATLALPVWAYYMKSVYDDKTINISKEDFEPPSVPVTIDTDCWNYTKKDKVEDAGESFDF